MAAISANTQILTVELLEEKLESFAFSFMGRLEGRLEKIPIQMCNKEKRGDVILISQMSNNNEMMKEEEDEVIHFKAPVENGGDVLQIKNGKFRGLKEINQEILRETFPEDLRQSSGKVLGGVGIFNIRRRIRNGTLQFLFKNGFSILVKEVCLLKGTILRRAQDCKTQKFQLKIQETVKIKRDGGIRTKKKVRKKARKKWRWKNYNPLGWRG